MHGGWARWVAAAAAAEAATTFPVTPLIQPVWTQYHGFLHHRLVHSVWTMCCEDSSLTAAGWASSSIEGRIAVEYFDPSPEVQASKYAFRAHRQTVDGADHVFPINAIAYHPM